MSASSSPGCSAGSTASLFDNLSPHASHDGNSTTFSQRNARSLMLGFASVMSLWFGSNDIFSAGFGLIILNVIWGVVKDGVLWVWKSLKSRLTYSVTVRSKDEIHTWLMEWFATQSYMTQTHCMTLKTVRNRNDDADDENADSRPKILCFPSVGQHFIKYKGKYVTFNRTEDKSALSDDSGGLTIERGEELTITLYHYNKDILNDLVKEAVDLNFAKLKNKTSIHTADQWGDWESSVKKDKRDLASVVLEETVATALEKDLKFFVDSKEDVFDAKKDRARGVPYRRGYLLHGPPGTGKTSFILALAGKMGYDLCTLNINSEGLDDMKLLTLLQRPPKKSFVVLEDVDGLFHKRHKEGGGKLTFSGLLNALDGIASTDGRILFMTTNHIERLSPALIRPGRIDRKFLFDYASSMQTRTMFEQFFGKEDYEEVIEVIVDRVADNKVTTAQLQGWFILYSSEPERLAEASILDEFISESTKENSRTDDLDDKEEEGEVKEKKDKEEVKEDKKNVEEKDEKEKEKDGAEEISEVQKGSL